MEQLLNEFTVNRSVDHTWAVLTDVERIAPCMPGAQLQEIEGDVYRGVVKVKLGPISTAFKGQASFVERDDAHHRAVLKGEGRDTGGKGSADALITAQAEAVSAHVTKVVVSTELRVSGKVAQFGRGIMGDVSEKLMAQFAHNLNTMLDAEDDTPAEAQAAAEEAVAHAAEVAADAASHTADAAAADAAAPTIRTIQGPAAEPIELSDLAGGAMVKRLVPALGALLVLLLLFRRRK